MSDGDAQLVERAVRGESSAYGELYDMYIERIYRFLYIKVGRREDAEDLAQTVFLKALENMPRYKDMGYPFSSWLYRIASNAVIDYYRTSRPVVDLEDIDEAKLGVISKELEVDVQTALDITRVKKALSLIKEEYQDVIVLRFIEDMSVKDVAAFIDKTEGAVKLITHRGLAALRKALGEENKKAKTKK